MRVGCGRSRPPAGVQPRAAWTALQTKRTCVVSPDGKSVAFVRGAGSERGSGRRGGSELWVRSLADGKETHLAQSDGAIGGIAWAPDGSKLSYSAGAQTIRHDEAPEYSGAKIIYTITERSARPVVRDTGDGRTA